MSDAIESAIERFAARVKARWANAAHEYRQQAVAYLCGLYERCVDADLVDRHFLSEFANGDDSTYAQRIGELLLADRLWNYGYSLSSKNHGPDFRAEKDGKVVWFELVCPLPNGVPSDNLTPPGKGEIRMIRAVPTEVALRWTSAIAEKASKLLGRADKPGYLANGTVKACEPYVIVVNPCLLSFTHSDMNGISQLPYPVETCFAVGPITVTLDRNTAAVLSTAHSQRFHLQKPNGSEVPANSFLDIKFGPISAVWGVDLHDGVVVGQHSTAVAVYNPHAINPVDDLPADESWRCSIRGDHYELSRVRDGE